MAKFKVIYDNLVTDDEIVEIIEANSVMEVDAIAQKHSRRAGLSEGNYDTYVEHHWENGSLSGTEFIDIDSIVYNVDSFADNHDWTLAERTGEKWERLFEVFAGVKWK